MNIYASRIAQEVERDYANEPEYKNTILSFLNSVSPYLDLHPEIEKHSILERIIMPERIIEFKVTWVDDNDIIQVNRGYRVQFNSALGPYKGGLRFDNSVNLSILKFLGFEQSLKNSLSTLPLGGGKGGSDFSPIGKSDNEIMRFCQAYMNELYHFIGPKMDVPAGDFGVGAREIGYLYGQYKKLTHVVDGTLSSKGLSYGGSKGRKEATGFGLLYFTSLLLSHFLHKTMKGERVIISGSGNVGLHAALKAQELGGIVVGMNDISGTLYNPNGLDLEKIRIIKDVERKLLKDYVCDSRTEFDSNPKRLWKITASLALPCATQNEIDLKEAEDIVKSGVKVLVEGANMPCSNEATTYLMSHGVLFGPAKAANAGGVSVSGLEMAQNAMGLSYSAAEVDEKLKQIMTDIFNNVVNVAAEFNEPTNLLLGADIAGFMKIAEAMIAEGVI